MRYIRAWVEHLFHSRVTECTVLCVAESRRITPHMLRVSFSGRNLNAFATDENLHVKLLLPPPSVSRNRWLKADRDGKAQLRGKGIAPVFRKYTIRTINADAGRVEIDFVLHEDGGPGAKWASAARPGDLVGMIGPGGRGLVPADWYLLAGDETGLPAIGRMLESLPADACGLALIEVDNSKEEQDLPKPIGIELRWLHRNGAPPGTTRLLAEEIAGADIPTNGRGIFVWAAAEFEAIRTIRAHLRRDRNLHKQQHLAVAYWRRDSGPQNGDVPGE